MGGLVFPPEIVVLITQIAVDGDQITIAWEGGQGTFQVEGTDSLSDPNWIAVGGATQENEITINITNAQAAFFFRVSRE